MVADERVWALCASRSSDLPIGLGGYGSPMGSRGSKRRKPRRDLPDVSTAVRLDAGEADALTPMGIVAGFGRFLRASRSPYPEQRRAVHMIVGVAFGFLALVVLVAVIAGR